MWPAISVYILASVAGFSSVLAIGSPLFDGNQIALATRISGGMETTTALHPYVVYLKIYFPDTEYKYDISGVCTGSIVHELVVLTAAHCVKQQSLTDTDRSYIIVGATERDDPAAINIGMKSVMPHPDYLRDTVLGDIGLVFARRSLLEDRKGSVIPLASYPDLHFREQVKLLGWGDKSFSGEETTKLMRCFMRAIPCGFKDFGDPLQYFCMESYTASPIKGDSGGPVVTTYGPEKLLGVISGGQAPKPEQKVPDDKLFQRKSQSASVAYYHNWIVDHFPK